LRWDKDVADEKKPATCPNHRAVIELVPVK